MSGESNDRLLGYPAGGGTKRLMSRPAISLGQPNFPWSKSSTEGVRDLHQRQDFARELFGGGCEDRGGIPWVVGFAEMIPVDAAGFFQD